DRCPRSGTSIPPPGVRETGGDRPAASNPRSARRPVQNCAGSDWSVALRRLRGELDAREVLSNIPRKQGARPPPKKQACCKETSLLQRKKSRAGSPALKIVS